VGVEFGAYIEWHVAAVVGDRRVSTVRQDCREQSRSLCVLPGMEYYVYEILVVLFCCVQFGVVVCFKAFLVYDCNCQERREVMT
jgi:hypothetical protein